MFKLNKFALPVLAISLAFFACDDKGSDPVGPEPGTEEKTKFVISAWPIGSEGVADYLLTADDLTTGSISTKGNGIEQDGTYRYYVTYKNRFFSLLYGQGNPGAVTTYKLNTSGALEKASDFQHETVQVFAPAKDDILTIKVPRSGNESATYFRINADSSKIKAEGTINIVKLAGNGERAHFTWATQVGEKVFAPYMSIKGVSPDVFGTQYADSSWIAVFTYPDMKLEKVIKGNQTGAIGGYMTNGLAVDEAGDVYGFSPSNAYNSGKLISKKPSGYVRVKSGTTEFDNSYFFDVQQASGGYVVTHHIYVGNGNFIVRMLKAEERVEWGGGNRLAVVNVQNKSFKWIAGAPSQAEVSDFSFSNPYIDKEANKAYIGVTLADGSSYVYAIDAANATAVRGLKVEGGNITAISKLTYK
jgi:hypothetical protein